MRASVTMGERFTADRMLEDYYRLLYREGARADGAVADRQKDERRRPSLSGGALDSLG